VTRIGPNTKVIGIGLPRCGGQTLQEVLRTLLGEPCMHSPGNKWWAIDKYRAIVEVYVHPDTLDERYEGDVLYIMNHRREPDWLRSCSERHQLAQSDAWNHPIWRHPIEDFPRYRAEYLQSRCILPPERLLVWDLVSVPVWQIPCEFLGADIPDEPFPKVDRFAMEVTR